MRLQSIGRESTADRPAWFRQLVAAFEALRHRDAKQELKNQLTAAADYETELELLRRLQSQKVSPDQPDVVPPTDSPSGA